MRLLKESDVIRAVDRHTREDGTLGDDISVILEEVKTAFDKEKIIETLHRHRLDCEKSIGIKTDERQISYYEGQRSAFLEAMEIIDKWEKMYEQSTNRNPGR